MPRFTRFLDGWVAQTVRPDYGRSTAILLSQVFFSYSSAKALLSAGLRYEALVVGLGGVLGAAYHSCEERMWCGAALTVNEWRLVNDFAFYTLLATFVAVASGLSTKWQTCVRVTLAAADVLILKLLGSNLQAQAFRAVLPFVLLAAIWNLSNLRRGCHADMLVGAAGLLTPALLLYASAHGDNDFDDLGAEPGQPHYRLASTPPTDHFWLFHSIWHGASIGAAHIALTCRVPRTGEAGERPRRANNPRRRAPARHWLAVLLIHYMPSTKARKAALKEATEGAPPPAVEDKKEN
uniref:Uncharacterized protein n=1 Tax=Pyramimonas obovata TaxID=1411642 RepID=A0A7S0QTN6_9CHLO|mmetsp:Transcript_11135/g.23230  ORF Transcript_11135/g.23230 Transcript_11135/m.23230 type:complete len:294 (+) Transcript_11135:115-996(+)|eukprot:CAMPEP_0118936512 /NCGR_PEP_ID=MMETSP1169-20130426/19290_1 /TAXON_ID=36882 /ORGANISM="Pyramimonas obovata, Strain CCMP722" /LENGTH=293 /DNA_ID=CAMNT_0006879805 /DNA_START=62 /DNA_END=943 /DNA_ORIENTATION=+